jgi:glutamate-1-semialdehyde 2,1-aminomutase
MTSAEWFAEAQALIPGGVNSPVRAFRGVGGTPFFVARGEGARLHDVEGRSYLDYVMSWGPLVLGHAPKRVVEALRQALDRGTSYGAPTPGEVELARETRRAVPSMELLRLVSSGTEAAMSALRVARGFTGRSRLVKFEGCYHGHADSLLVKAGSGGATFGVPDSLGVPPDLARLTLTVPYNDLDAVRAVFAAEGRDIAAVIVEPVAGNMGVVPPAPGFLSGLRELTADHGALLVFDEVITGFRLAYGGAQSFFAIEPDLTVLGKVMGGGFPCAAFGGRREVMERLAPVGPVYQAGTLSGNPVAVAAGIAALDLARERDPYPELTKTAERLAEGVADAFGRAGLPHVVNRVGSMLSVFFRDAAVRSFADAAAADHAMYARLHHHMLEAGVYLPPSGYELWSLCTAHGDDEIDAVLRAASAFGG